MLPPAGEKHHPAEHIQNDAQHSGGDGVDKKGFPAGVFPQSGRNQEGAEGEEDGDGQGGGMVNDRAKRAGGSFRDGGEDADEQEAEGAQEEEDDGGSQQSMGLDIEIKPDNEEHAEEAEKVKGGGLNAAVGGESKLADGAADGVEALPERGGNDGEHQKQSRSNYAGDGG